MDWRFQVYCNGLEEHYIDLACPFGKTNSSVEFCPPVALFARSAAVRYSQQFGVDRLTLGTHVDDIFGGFKRERTFSRACHFRWWLCDTGRRLTVKFNMKITKTPMPARKQVILGRLWNSVNNRVKSASTKIVKYREKIASMVQEDVTSREKIESLHGCLQYVADVEP